MSTSEDRYKAAVHGMQTGVTLKIARGASTDTTPKHLRIGVNVAIVNHSSLAQILIARGVITQEEYLEAIAAGMEAEVATYENELGVSLA